MRGISTRAIAAAVAAALVGGPVAPSFAQPAGKSPNDAQMTQAKDLVNKAITKSQAGDHASAIDLYLQAYNIAPLPLLLSNLGSEYQQAQKPVEALKYFCKYLEVEPTGPNASYATAQAKVLQTQLHNSVDDANVCKPVPVQPPPVPAVVTPPPQPPAPTGSSAQDSPPDGSAGRPLKLAGIGVGVAGLVLASLGVVYGSKASTISNDITNHPIGQPWPDNIKDQEAEGQSDENKQIAFLAIGGAAIAIGVVLYTLGRKKSAAAAEHAMIVPTVAPGASGLALVGRF